MTVSSIVVRATAVWSGVETEFPTGIQIIDRSQLIVSLVPDEGERQVLTLGLHYSVTLSPAGVATVAPLAAFPLSAGVVSFVRQTPMTQTYDPTATDTYDAAGHAAALDRSAMRVAELSVKVDDIGASSIIVAGGAASVPEGAVYISDGGGGAVAGPTAAEIEAARIAAVGAAGTATGAAGVATGAATAAGQAADRAEAAAATVEGAVSYAVAQDLTPEEKAQAQSNLGLEGLQNALTPFGFTAAEGQTVFDLGMSPSPNACIFSQNGAWLSGGVDYVIAGSTLTLSTAAEAGDRISGVAIGAFEVANAMLPAANLADLGDKAAARANLGLGAGATATKATEALAVEGTDATTFMTPAATALVTPILQSLSAVNTTQSIALAVIPADATVPQITEGTQILTLAITPKRATSKIRVRYAVPTNLGASGAHCAALFLNGATSAVVATSIYVGGNFGHMLTGEYEFSPGSVGVQTLTVRAGTQATGGFANAAGSTSAGGPFRSTIVAEEIAQ